MPFRLKNTGTTYQCCMKRCLHKQIGKNAKPYIDDIIIKSSKVGDLIQDLSETFNNLQKFKIKLNLESVPSGYHPANCSAISYRLTKLKPIQ